MNKSVKIKISKTSYKLFGLYILIFYLIPLITNIVYPEEFSNIYQNTSAIWPILVFVLILFLVFILDIILPRLIFPNIFIKPFKYIINSDNLNLLFSILFLISSIHFFNNFNINFRHKQSISESGGLVTLLFFMRIYFKAYIFMLLGFFYTGRVSSFKKKLISLIVLLSYIFSLNSSWDAIFIFVIFILFINRGDSLFSSKVTQTLSAFLSKNTRIIIIFFMLLAVIFIGYANKIGPEQTFILFSKVELLWIKVVKRLSVWYISILTAGVNFIENPSFATDALFGTIESVFYRFKILLGIDAVKPEVWSINRENYLHLFRDHSNARTGSSPGVFASAFYIPIFPLNIFIISLYIIFILRKFSELFRKKAKKVSFIGLLILMFFLIPLFESPVNLLNFIDKGFIYFIFFIAAVKSFK